MDHPITLSDEKIMLLAEALAIYAVALEEAGARAAGDDPTPYGEDAKECARMLKRLPISDELRTQVRETAERVLDVAAIRPI